MGTQLDAFLTSGLNFMGNFVHETITFREQPYAQANVSEIGTSQDWVSGGKKLLRRCSIHLAITSEFTPEIRIGEFLTARGIVMKIESIDRDPTGYTLQVVEVTK